MPVFNLELQFDDSGAVRGINSLKNLEKAAGSAKSAIEKGWKLDSLGRWHDELGRYASAAERAALGVKSLGAGASAASKDIQKTGASAAAATATIQKLGNATSDACGKIRSLAAQIVGLVGVYKTLDTAVSLVKRGMDFNASIESSQIAIASVVAATNKISDAQGKVLQGVEKFQAAQTISKDIMDEIQVLALQTTATFDSLADGVAGVIAPATKAGIEIEKLPKFAVMAAQAMTTMKIPVQQMRTEIEALLSGNINRAQDILATNLGITGEMVKNWQKQNTLVEELTKRMEAFAFAGQAVAESWAGLRGNMEDALNFLSGKAGRGIFEGAKQSYKELLDYMISTEGTVGVGKDFENIMQLITDIQDAIGDKLITVTREFIAYLRELNEPENLAEFKKDLEDIWGVATTAFDAISTAGRLIVDFGGRIVEGWHNLPEPIREYGLIMAILGGAKVKAALAILSTLSNTIRGVMEVARGNLSFWDFATSNGEELSAIFDEMDKKAEETTKKISQTYSQFRENFVGPQPEKKKYDVASAIGGFAKKDDGKRFAEAVKRYQTGIETLRNEVEALEAAMDPTLSSFDRSVAKINAERDAAIKNADVKKEETIRRKQATVAQAEEVAQLEKKKATLQAQEKLDALEVKNLQDKISFYKELGELTGDYSSSAKLQNRLIEKQAKEFEKLEGVSEDLVAEWERLAKLQVSTDPFDGAYRGLMKFTAQYGNDAAQWENITYNFASDFESTTRGMFDEFLDTGKVSFDSLSDLFKQLLKDMAYQALVQPIVMSVVGGVAGAMGGGSAGGGSTGGAGGGLTGMAMNAAQSYAIGKITDGVTTSLVGQLDSWAASLFPSTFAPSQAAAEAVLGEQLLSGGGSYAAMNSPTSTLSGSFAGAAPTIGGAGLGAGVGSMVSPFVNNVLGIQNNSGAQIGSTIGGLGATAVLGTLALTNAWNPGGWVAGALAGLSAITGGALGSLFGGKKKKKVPKLYLGTTLNLANELTGELADAYTWGGRERDYWDTGGAYSVGAGAGNQLSNETAYQMAGSLQTLAEGLVNRAQSFAESLASVDYGLKESYLAGLAAQGTISKNARFDGEYITEENIQAYVDELTGQVEEHIVNALGSVDLKPVTIAADGLAADTVGELTTSLKEAFGFFDLAAAFEDEDLQRQFILSAQQQIVNAFTGMDLSFLRVDFDQNSFAGLQKAYAAIAAWESVTASIENILNPVDSLTTSLSAASSQFNGWIDNLRALGWQEEAIAEIEAQRADYLEEYRIAAVGALEQDLHLRQIALSSGSDSSSFAMQQLLYQQANERDDIRAQVGEDSQYYANLLAIQEAERLQLEMNQLRQQEEERLNKEISASRQLVSSLDNLTDTLDRALHDLWTGDNNLMGTRYDEALAQFNDAYARGMAGDEEALQELPSIGQTVLQLGREQLASRGEYDDAFYSVAWKLEQAQLVAKRELDAQETALAYQERQLSILSSQWVAEEQTALTTAQISAKIDSLQAAMTKALSGYVQTDSSSLPSKLLPGTGIWGSNYATADDLIRAKVKTLNEDAYKGKTDWNKESFLAEVATYNITLEEWYRGQGKIEGFASGGLTPTNTPFIVGENGPELMMSSQTYGVLSNRDSIDLIAQDRAARMFDLTVLVEELRELKSLTRQILVKVDKAAYFSEKTYGYMRMWDAEGMPAAATV